MAWKVVPSYLFWTIVHLELYFVDARFCGLIKFFLWCYFCFCVSILLSLWLLCILFIFNIIYFTCQFFFKV